MIQGKKGTKERRNKGREGGRTAVGGGVGKGRRNEGSRDQGRERKKGDRKGERERGELLCRVPDNPCGYSRLNEEEPNSSLLKDDPNIVTSSQRVKDKMV